MRTMISSLSVHSMPEHPSSPGTFATSRSRTRCSGFPSSAQKTSWQSWSNTMARLTLRLPDTLRDRLAERADQEGVSLNQFLVFLLSQATTLDSLRVQRQRFEALRARVP